MRRVFHNLDRPEYKDSRITGFSGKIPYNVASIYLDYIANRHYWEIGLNADSVSIYGNTTVKVEILGNNEYDTTAITTSTFLMSCKDSNYMLYSVDASKTFDDLSIVPYDICGFNNIIRYSSSSDSTMQKNQFFHIRLSFENYGNSGGFGKLNGSYVYRFSITLSTTDILNGIDRNDIMLDSVHQSLCNSLSDKQLNDGDKYTSSDVNNDTMPTLYKQFVVNYPTLASFSTGYIHGSSDTYTLHTRLFNKESTSYTIPIDKEYVIDMNSLIDVRELRTDFTNSLSNELFYSEGNGLLTGFNDVIDFNRIYRLMQNDYFDDTTNYSNQYQIYPKDYTDAKSLLKGNMQKCLYSINSKNNGVMLRFIGLDGEIDQLLLDRLSDNFESSYDSIDTSYLDNNYKKYNSFQNPEKIPFKFGADTNRQYGSIITNSNIFNRKFSNTINCGYEYIDDKALYSLVGLLTSPIIMMITRKEAGSNVSGMQAYDYRQVVFTKQPTLVHDATKHKVSFIALINYINI